MSNTIGITKDLDSSRTEALQGLLSSLGYHLGDNLAPGTPLSTEQLQKLSQNVNEILGDGVDRSLASGDNKPSQLLNGDGLPIIDISEPVDEASHTDTSSTLILDQDLVPLALLQPEEREQWRRERDRILDLFEQEERLQQSQEEQVAEEERKDATKKRKEAVKVELEQLNVARELQKKMGKALVQHAKGMGENGQEEDSRTKSEITSSVAKKSVSFADAPTMGASKGGVEAVIHQSAWGDVIPGRLRAQSRIPPASKTQEQEYLMKMRVVERNPAGTPPSLQADSDDESTSSAGRISAHMDDDSPKEGDGSSSSNSGLSDDEPLEEGFDYDAAQHQREVALEYHKKRHTIGAETAKAMTGGILDDSELYESTNEQSPLSRFRADRMVAAYNKSRGPISASVGETIVPASRQRSLRNAVRLGKLENDELTGGHSGESGSEDETIREVIQMLQTGNIKNAGPDLNPSSVSTVAPRGTSDALEPPFGGALHAPRGAKPPQPTMSRVVERKAPISTPSRRFPIHDPSQKSPAKTSGVAPPMIIDSPSFPMTAPSSSSSLVTSWSDDQVRLNPVPSVKSSVTQDTTIRSLISPQKPSSKRPVSKFMSERRK